MVVLNRGSVYWKDAETGQCRSDLPTRASASGTRESKQREKQVVHVKCDRKKRSKLASALGSIRSQIDRMASSLQQPHGGKMAGGCRASMTVVDFCAYKPKEVRSVVRGLGVFDEQKQPLNFHYIFISSDSIYEVCERGLQRRAGKLARTGVGGAISPNMGETEAILRPSAEKGCERGMKVECARDGCISDDGSDCDASSSSSSRSSSSSGSGSERESKSESDRKGNNNDFPLLCESHAVRPTSTRMIEKIQEKGQVWTPETPM